MSFALLPAPRAQTLLPGRGPAPLGLRGLSDLPAGLGELARALLPGSGSADAARLTVTVAAAGLPRLGDDESFRLRLGAETVQLEAATAAGARHGLHALSQLWHAHAGPGALSAALIEDAPRHPWRGLMVDVARRPLPMDALLRLLDTLAAARLNVLHWHLCDDQAWRLASERHPRLQERADGGFHYTLDEARTLVREAGARGIRVVPELDLPGHCWALGLAYPELLCAPAPTAPQRGFGVFGCAVDPQNEALYDFLDGLIGEWATVFTDDYIHLGGDEMEPRPWAALAAARGGTVAGMQAHYLRRVGEVLQRHGRRLVAWDELGEADATLPAGSLLQAWRGEGALRFPAPGAAGRIRSAGYYLDLIHPAAWHWRRRPQPGAQASEPQAGECWALEAQLGTWKVEGRFWLDGSEGPRLWLRSSGTLSEGLAPLRVDDPLFQWRLRVDSDLGELELWGFEDGWLRQGNRRVPCRWQALGVQAARDWPPAGVTGAATLNVLGGEAALWSELVDAPQLGLRLGPRLLAVAERLWSDPEITEDAQAALPARLAAAQRWMVETGRVDADQAAPLLTALAPGKTAALRALAAWLEPAAGYGRQHAKKLRGAYTQDEPLDRLADALPAESALMTALGDSASDWRAALAGLQDALPGWRGLPVSPAMLDALDRLARLGQRLWSDHGLVDAAAAQATLHEAAVPIDEMVPALVEPLQRRLDARRGVEVAR